MPDLTRTESYDYSLPDALVASRPPANRSDARMLIIDGERPFVDARVPDLAAWLEPGDVVVFNDARVVSARLRAHRATGGRVEVFVVGTEREGVWNDGHRCVALLRANKALDVGERLSLAGDPAATLEIADRHPGGVVSLVLHDTDRSVLELLDALGETPLPPYILKSRVAREESEIAAYDRSRYQTVFAKRPGAVAAPTAGLHFDEEAIRSLHETGIRTATISLLVGIGTFRPVQSQSLDEHEMHVEHYEISHEAVATIQHARATGHRVVAVGTTVVRTLEACVVKHGNLVAGAGSTDLFIRPGFPFRVVDLLVTNFHLPKSTLLALVCAFGGYEPVMRAYRHAVESRYRFYSYGDCMLVHRPSSTRDEGAGR